MVKSVPWLHLLVVKWALQVTRVPLVFAPHYQPYTTWQHATLVQKLWNISQHDLETFAACGD